MIQLSQLQKIQLYEDGYVHIPQVAPLSLVNDAKSEINAFLGQHSDLVDKEALANERLCSELKADERILNLFHKTDARSIVESAIGFNKIVLSKNVQIALRFPIKNRKPFELDPHVDGFHPTQEETPGSILPFTAIVGIFLNDLDKDWSGNFTVWPGSHRLSEKYFQQHKPDSDLRFGIPPIKLPPPVQLKVKAGDMIFAHFQLAHDASMNLQEAIRYAVFFRMNHIEQPKDSIEVLSNIWRYWDGMADL
ncbi:MAG: phytanoyl-CoA dioxygenase family protein [Bdellovibrionaceae bacterium]|nr:phytanoyl-CoA dioxygenase family protein [Bdellovibrio sp.]